MFEMNILDEIQKYEELFQEAGDIALGLQGKSESYRKGDTGNKDVDVVTEADKEVQERILEGLSKTNLTKFELKAEEATPSLKKFAKNSQYVITLDPVDGTRIYADGKKMYSVLVMVHDKTMPIYTYNYYPAVDWGVKIVMDDIEFLGDKPRLEYKNKEKVIAYHSFRNDPKSQVPKLYGKLTKEGYQFVDKDEIAPDVGSCTQLMLGMVDGTYHFGGSASDYLLSLHYGLASELKIIQNLDLTRTEDDSAGEYYGGYYLVRK